MARAGWEARPGSERRRPAAGQRPVPSAGQNTVLPAPAHSGLRPPFTTKERVRPLAGTKRARRAAKPRRGVTSLVALTRARPKLPSTPAPAAAPALACACRRARPTRTQSTICLTNFPHPVSPVGLHRGQRFSPVRKSGAALALQAQGNIGGSGSFFWMRAQTLAWQ